MVNTTTWIGAPPPALDRRGLADRLASAWGLSGDLSPLYGERDLNHRLVTARGERFLVKLSHPDTPPAALALEERVLEHLARSAPALPVPRIVPDLDGRPHRPLGSGGYLRVLSWCEGRAHDLATAPAASREAAGACLARLGLALEGCATDGVRHDLAWDLQRFGALAPLLPDASRALGSLDLPRDVPRPLPDRLARLLDRFDARIAPALARLPRQLIHNDLNPDNVLFADADPGRITGVIDFGDLVEAPVVCDLAVAGAYLVRETGEDSLGGVLEFVRAYDAVRPLEEEALTLLPALLRCRLATTLLIQGARVHQGQERAGDLVATVVQAGRRLVALEDLGEAAVGERLRSVCGADRRQRP